MVKRRGENWDFQAFVSSEVQPVLRSPRGGGIARGGVSARVFQGKLRYPPPMQVCMSGTVHGHRQKTSWV